MKDKHKKRDLIINIIYIPIMVIASIYTVYYMWLSFNLKQYADLCICLVVMHFSIYIISKASKDIIAIINDWRNNKNEQQE